MLFVTISLITSVSIIGIYLRISDPIDFGDWFIEDNGWITILITVLCIGSVAGYIYWIWWITLIIDILILLIVLSVYLIFWFKNN